TGIPLVHQLRSIRGRTTDAGIYPHARQDRKRGESTTAHNAIAEHAGLGGKQGAPRQRVEDSDSAATPASIAFEHFGFLG
ncbi:unnamed protein product, partial [Pylaiella littoralis]